MIGTNQGSSRAGFWLGGLTALFSLSVLAGAGPDGAKYLCILNRGPAVELSGITIDGKPFPSDVSVRVESVSGETLSTTGGALKTFAGNKMLDSLSIEPYSVTTLILP